MKPLPFHNGSNGSVAGLPQPVKIVAHVQFGGTLSDADMHDIVTFLENLTGEIATAPIPPSEPVAPPRYWHGPPGPDQDKYHGEKRMSRGVQIVPVQ